MCYKQTKLERQTQKIHGTFIIYSDCNKVQVVQDGTPVYQINIDLSKQYLPLDKSDKDYGRYFTLGFCLKLCRKWLQDRLSYYEFSEEVY